MKSHVPDHEFLPIKTFQSFEVDPLAGITGTLAKLESTGEEIMDPSVGTANCRRLAQRQLNAGYRASKAVIRSTHCYWWQGI